MTGESLGLGHWTNGSCALCASLVLSFMSTYTSIPAVTGPQSLGNRGQSLGSRLLAVGTLVFRTHPSF